MYNKCPVNTNELAENLSYERLLTLHWNKVAGSDYWLLCLAPNLLIQYWRKRRPFYVLTMQGLQMAMSSSQSYCILPIPFPIPIVIAERAVPDSEPVPVQRGDGAFISSGFSPEWISLCVVVSESKAH